MPVTIIFSWALGDTYEVKAFQDLGQIKVEMLFCLQWIAKVKEVSMRFGGNMFIHFHS